MSAIFKCIGKFLDAIPAGFLEGMLAGMFLLMAFPLVILVVFEPNIFARSFYILTAFLCFGASIHSLFRSFTAILKEEFGDRIIAPTFNNCHVSFTREDNADKVH